ncbi:MAG: hypothetical protein K6E10_08040 [Eubacterium sp.]|nr:hypothetical protein [Eubacterium sp.]
MNIRRLIKVNLINIGLLALIVGFRIAAGLLFDDHDGTSNYLMVNAITILFGLGWAGFAIYSNITVIKEDKIDRKKSLQELKSRINSAGNKKFFKAERNHLITMLDSLDLRKKYFEAMDKDSKLRELFFLTENQMMRNVTNAAEYMETFDYISGRDTGYLNTVCNDSQVLLDKFNKLVELSVTYDDEAKEYDTREIDDMIDALETMKKTGRATLGS